jgi:site-specific DNA-methyltransferase (adenine-specific)
MREMNIEYLKPSELVPYESNPRKNDPAVKPVAESIKKFGFRQPIVIDKNNVVVCGHTRLKAAKRLRLGKVPCVRADDLTDEEIRAYRLADNKTAELATWDVDLLNAELNLIDDIDMTTFGFELPDPEPEEDGFDFDAAVEKIETPKTQPGTIYQLGAHRLMCGSSTDAADVAKLTAGVPMSMMFTDPPYNIDYTGGTKDHLKIKNDKMAGTEFYQFLLSFYQRAEEVLEPGATVYICHADSESLTFRQAFVDSGLLLKQCLIWAKNTFTLGRQDFQWQHEPILYGWKAGAKHRWFGGRKQGTTINDNFPVVMSQDADGSMLINFASGNKNLVLRVPAAEVVNTEDASTLIYVDKPKRNGEHPTMKPIALCARCIKNSSKRGDTVLDLFGGSGSTLVACEQLHRACYMMELDPVYCDVIVERWEQLTGATAVTIGTAAD